MNSPSNNVQIDHAGKMVDPRRKTEDEALLRVFQDESNKIEGMGPARNEEVAALVQFVGLGVVTLNDLEELVHTFQPGAKFRGFPGMDVRVGSHIAPPGGREIVVTIGAILDLANLNTEHPYLIHHRYETLHPFMDGNGRSGRALWAWQMLKYGYRPGLELGFLHAFYYQTLDWGRFIPDDAA